MYTASEIKVMNALKSAKAFSRESKMEYGACALSAGVSRNHLYKPLTGLGRVIINKTNPSPSLKAGNLVLQERIGRSTYLWLTKEGKDWDYVEPKKDKKAKKKRKKEKTEKTPFIKEEITEVEKQLEKLKSKKGAKEEDIKFKEEYLEELEGKYKKVVEALPPKPKEVLEEKERLIKKGERRFKKWEGNVKKQRLEVEDLLREYLLTIVVRKDDAKIYGFKSGFALKSRILKMIAMLAKDDVHWRKHNIRVEKTTNSQGIEVRNILTD